MKKNNTFNVIFTFYQNVPFISQSLLKYEADDNNMQPRVSYD